MTLSEMQTILKRRFTDRLIASLSQTDPDLVFGETQEYASLLADELISELTDEMNDQMMVFYQP